MLPTKYYSFTYLSHLNFPIIHDTWILYFIMFLNKSKFKRVTIREEANTSIFSLASPNFKQDKNQSKLDFLCSPKNLYVKPVTFSIMVCSNTAFESIYVEMESWEWKLPDWLSAHIRRDTSCLSCFTHLLTHASLSHCHQKENLNLILYFSLQNNDK
jgi:hypothetical protein